MRLRWLVCSILNKCTKRTCLWTSVIWSQFFYHDLLTHIYMLIRWGLRSRWLIYMLVKFYFISNQWQSFLPLFLSYGIRRGWKEMVTIYRHATTTLTTTSRLYSLIIQYWFSPVFKSLFAFFPQLLFFQLFFFSELRTVAFFINFNRHANSVVGALLMRRLYFWKNNERFRKYWGKIILDKINIYSRHYFVNCKLHTISSEVFDIILGLFRTR